MVGIIKYKHAFLEQARVGYENFCYQNRLNRNYHNLIQRRHNQNMKFEFTESNIDKIEKINYLLNSKFIEAYKHAELFETNLLDKIKNKDTFVSDYEIEMELQLWSPEKYAGISELEGNPFFTYTPTINYIRSDSGNPIMISERTDWLLKENHNEFKFSEHPLKQQHHCWLLHDLYDHTYLSWQDIIDIEEIWLEIIVKIQSIGKI